VFRFFIAFSNKLMTVVALPVMENSNPNENSTCRFRLTPISKMFGLSPDSLMIVVAQATGMANVM
jgi:hypothetical protein